jgi:hypothetical protein
MGFVTSLDIPGGKLVETQQKLRGIVVFRSRKKSSVTNVKSLGFPSPARDALGQRVPCDVVPYLPQAETTVKRLPAELRAALQLLAERQKPAIPAAVISLPARHDKDTQPHKKTPHAWHGVKVGCGSRITALRAKQRCAPPAAGGS